MTGTMSYEVFVSDGVPRTIELRLPDGGPIVSSPLASTLIYGQRDAVLVDPPFTREQTVRVGHWIDRSGKRLAYLYSSIPPTGTVTTGSAPLSCWTASPAPPSTRPRAPSG